MEGGGLGWGRGHEPWGSYMYMPWARARTPKIPPDTVPPRQVALDMTHTSQGPGPALLLRHKAVALEFLPIGAQLLLKAALPLAGILATASDRCRKTGPLQTPASPGAVLQRARRIHVSWCPAQQMDSRANKCDVIIGNDMTSQSRKDLRQCVLSH